MKSSVQDILDYIKENGKLPAMEYEVSLSSKSLLLMGAVIVGSFGLLMVIWAVISSLKKQ